jgi:branched-chain amino acid transport system substrate-binding protein
MPPTSAVGRPDRRRFLRLTALAGAAALTGCAASDTRDGTPPIRLGYVSPQSGPLFAFGEADAFVVADVQRALVGGLKVGGRTHPVEILVRDSQSSPERAGDLARELITRDQVTMLLAAPTPETTNPVADAGERYGTPCVTTGTPYQSWYLRRDPAPDPADPKPYRFTWHFSWGLEDIIAVFADMWSQVANNGVLGGLWPDDGDGRAWGRTFPKVLGAQGYRVLDMGRYQAGQDSFAAELDKLEAGGAGIVTGVPPPADFATFWKQAADRGYRPPVVSIGRAMFPAFIEAMGTAAGVSTEVWWSPGHPFRSSLTGASARQLAEAYQDQTGRQWTQLIGPVHALFEVATAALRAAGDIGDPRALAEAVRATSMATIAGPVDWGRAQADFPNVSRTPLAGGQWRRGTTWPFELQVVSNAVHPEIPATGELRPIR